MRICVLCEANFSTQPSWQSLLGIEKQKIICESCSKTFERADIVNKTSYLSSITSLYAYNEAMQSYLHQFKFLQDIALAAVFQEELRAVLLKKKNIVPIPVHPDKRMARTFGQVEALLQYAQIPYDQKLEKKDDVVMSGKTREERLAIKALFQLHPNVQIQAKTYTLVDDIYTTGTTLNQAAKILLQAGAKRVEAVTLIRA